MGRKMETPVFIPLGTLNLLDTILPTGSSQTDLLTLLASTHLYSTSPWLYICLLPVTQMLVSHSVCRTSAPNSVPLKDVDIAGMLRETLVPSVVLANTFRGTWISLGIDGLEW